jgi:hypothetical protein
LVCYWIIFSVVGLHGQVRALYYCGGSIQKTTRINFLLNLANDGSIDIVDALLAAQHYVEILPLGEEYIECGDVNCNGSVDIIDALLIAQKHVGLNPVGWCL